MQYAATFGYTVWLRPEDPRWLAAASRTTARLATRLGLPGVPALAETIALRTIFELVRATGARVHLCRLSSAAGVDAACAEAKAEGLPVTCDVGVNHLHLTDIDIGYFDTLMPPDSAAARARATATRCARRSPTARSTRCAPTTRPVDDDAKHMPFGEAEPGATGLELLLPLALDWGAQAGLGLAATLAPVTARAAAVLGVEAGRLVPGARADICLFDPARRWRVRAAALASQGKNTPFLGEELAGRVVRTLVAGRTVHSA